MNFDLRLPLGALFSFNGVLLILHGIFSDRVIYRRSLDININLGWGLIMLVFGVVMLFLAWRGRRDAP